MGLAAAAVLVAAGAPASAQNLSTASNGSSSTNGGTANGALTPAAAPADASTGAAAQADAQPGPAALHYKGITLTPGGFMAAETVWRQRGLSADINTPFNALPMPGSSQYHLSEFAGSGRQSRIAMLAQGTLSHVKIGGYYEGDFLSAGVTSNANQSNSYTFRQRQFWAQAAFTNGVTVTGGQMWSLVTETSHGVDNRTENLPMTIDAQYHVGFSWARQFGFRVAKDFGNKTWLAVSLENPQTTFAVHGQSNNFLLGAAGNGGGLYNPTANYTFSYMPDVIAKAAFEPHAGQHYEVFGIFSTFRDRVFPTGRAPYNYHTAGGGVGVNARISVAKNAATFGIHYVMGSGVGRYGTSSLPDATVRADGTLALIKSQQVLGTLQFHHKKLDVFFNGGAEFAGRQAQTTGATTAVGYGSSLFNNSGCMTEPAPGAGGFAPGALSACTADTHDVIEGTGGFWYTFYQGSKGMVRFGTQVSHLVRQAWSGVGGAPQANDNMLFTSFRYFLP
ncbi:MAG: hypothetical protein KGN76_05315 [Acidobacteriota bacterium]|nr:hypothetical protein [Acidobacteriota bacterium]